MSREIDRRLYLGGPDTAAILGVSPWETPLSVWLRKTGRADPVEMNEAMRAGQVLECAVLNFAGEELGYPVKPGPFIHQKRTHLGGHLDGIKADKTELIEAKTSRVRNGWGEPGTDEVPAHVATQALHYLGLVPTAGVCWVPVLFSGLEFALYRVERNDELIGQIREMATRWWRDYVIADQPPPPINGADVALLYPRDSGAAVIADDVTVATHRELLDLRVRMKADEARRDELESRIKLALGEAATLTIGGDVAATWKTSSSNRFDAQALKAAQPEVYQQFVRPSTNRRLLVKEISQ